MSTGVLDNLGQGNATQGSAIKDSVSINIGDTFSFNWNWFSGEGNPSSFNDFAFVTLSLNGNSVLANTSTPDNSNGTFSWTATGSGLLNWGIGVMDVGDTIVDSWLTVSNIQTSSSVPEPGSMALLGLALAGLGYSRRRVQI